MVMPDPFFKDGTWDVVYEQGVQAPVGSRIGLAIVSVKHELVYNGVPVGGMNLDVPSIGKGTVSAIKRFQREHKLKADGSIGPDSAVVLWRKRAIAEALRVGAPRMLLAQQKSLESADDPACVSAGPDADPHKRDRGLAQINAFYHGDAMPDEKAFTASLALQWQANYMREAFKGLGDWMLALAAYNVGWAEARRWDAAGRPKNTTAGQYVHVVLSRSG